LEKLKSNKSKMKGDKMKDIQKIMLGEPMFTPLYFSGTTSSFFGTDPSGAYFDVDDWRGVLGFENIIPGEGCSVLFLPWEGEGWKPFHTLKAKEVIDRVVKCFRLKKVELRSENIENKETRRLEALIEKNQFLECESR
jgi:hypothetical protein